MQRLHVHDLAGAMLKEGGYEHLCLPMEYEPKIFSKSDPRKEEGGLLWPERFSKEAVEQLKKELGLRGTASQLQLQPVPSTGALFNKEHIQHWQEKPRLNTVITSWDCTFKETGSSFVVGQVWAVADECFYLIEQIRDRLSFSDTLIAIRKLAYKYPQSTAHLIEEKANGSAIIDVLQNEIPSLIPVLPQGGKEARAHAIESLWSQKRVFLPPQNKYPWVGELVPEILEFPSSLNDDQIDAMTQGLTWLRERTLRLKIFKKSMENIGNIMDAY